MPTFSADFRSLNEPAIRHDIAHAAALGYSGTLLVSECGTTLDEYKHFVEIAADARPKGFQLVVHGSFNSIEETIDVCRFAESYGLEAVLLAYDPNFYPRSEEDVYHYTRRVSEETNLGVIIFGVATWGFARFHPSQFPPQLVERLAALETAIAVKYEANHPGLVAGMADIQRRVGDLIVVSDPMEFNGPGWIQAYGMQWMGTSGYEYFGDRVSRWFDLLQQDRWEEGMELYWSYAPARKARGALHAAVAGAKLIHRPAWKFMGWTACGRGLPTPVTRFPQMTTHHSLLAEIQPDGFTVARQRDHRGCKPLACGRRHS
jgi:4-hydroxy-tetrahydrodipicolinate synthase